MPVADAVIATSVVCLRRHRLRGADAVQLASALRARDADPAVDTMAAFDRQVREAARAEGFSVLPA